MIMNLHRDKKKSSNLEDFVITSMIQFLKINNQDSVSI